MKRREFLTGCSSALALTTLNFSDLMAFSTEAEKEIFVVIFLRGGCDALNLVAPVSDKNYVDAREQNIRITDSGEEKGWTLNNTLKNLDFALHKSAKPLLELYQSQNLAILHACGLTNGTRSHFDAMDLIEKGIGKKQTVNEGWLTRYLNFTSPQGFIPALATPNIPLSLLGSSQAVSMENPQNYTLKGDPRLKGILKSLYSDDSLLSKSVRTTLKTVNTIQQKIPKEYGPKSNYPDEWYANNFSNALKTIAQTIKMDVGLHIATADLTGWDTHENQAWFFNNLVNTLSKGLMAFYNDVQAYQDKLTVLVVSEFGRRLKGNRSHGTDHGYGGVMFALGGKIKGGKMYGKWNGLETENLDKGVDLAVTTDYRTVIGEILSQRLGVKDVQKVFPDFSLTNPLGFVR